MNKGAIWSLLAAGLVTGSYLEFQVHQSDGAADTRVIEAVEQATAQPPVHVEPTPRVIQHVPLVRPGELSSEEIVRRLKESGMSREQVRSRLQQLGYDPSLADRYFDTISEAPTSAPYNVAPSITNRQEIIEAMQTAYPPLLRDAGIGGSVRLYFFVEADGEVTKIEIDESSGHAALDDAALRVADVYRFSPGMNGEEPIGVWVNFPITFRVR